MGTKCKGNKGRCPTNQRVTQGAVLGNQTNQRGKLLGKGNTRHKGASPNQQGVTKPTNWAREPNQRSRVNQLVQQGATGAVGVGVQSKGCEPCPNCKVQVCPNQPRGSNQGVQGRNVNVCKGTVWNRTRVYKWANKQTKVNKPKPATNQGVHVYKVNCVGCQCGVMGSSPTKSARQRGNGVGKRGVTQPTKGKGQPTKG